ncbi:MAG: DUF2306 domain-containing protein [Alphaproteobacteria bacterium]
MPDVSLQPLLAAPAIIQWHAYAAFAALLLGFVQLVAPKGTVSHRTIGYAWAALMMWIAASSLWIHTIQQFGQWSLIHILSIVVLISVPLAVRHAHSHRVKAHRSAMLSLFLLALIGAGLFTFLPSRVMHEVFFGS